MTEDMFESWVESHQYTFINFYAPWCLWCQRLEPVWEALAEKVEEEELPVSIVRVDCIANKDLCIKLKIQVRTTHNKIFIKKNFFLFDFILQLCSLPILF